jgi:hypothetical protein
MASAEKHFILIFIVDMCLIIAVNKQLAINDPATCQEFIPGMREGERKRRYVLD